MNNIFKALIAGYGAKKLGGGCFGTVLVFIIIWVLLGQCGAAPAYKKPAKATEACNMSPEANYYPAAAMAPVNAFQEKSINLMSF